MKRIYFILITLLAVLSLSSCQEDGPVPMKWEFSDYDHEEVSAVYTPDYFNQIAIVAKPGYSGDITLKCTNYREIMLDVDNADGIFKSAEVGFTVKKIDGNTLRITFEPIEATDDNGIYDTVSAIGRTGRGTYITNMSIGRVK